MSETTVVVVKPLPVNYFESVDVFMALIRLFCEWFKRTKTPLAAEINSVIHCYIKGHEHRPHILYHTAWRLASPWKTLPLKWTLGWFTKLIFRCCFACINSELTQSNKLLEHDVYLRQTFHNFLCHTHLGDEKFPTAYPLKSAPSSFWYLRPSHKILDQIRDTIR